MAATTALAAMLVAGCSNSTDPASEFSRQTTVTVLTATMIAGEWKATDPHPDFFRLSVVPRESEQGAFGTRLTFSGVYWEGTGRIQGDAFVANMDTPGIAGSGSVLTARATDAGALLVTMRTNTTTMEFKFVRAD
jgi:hypothetical protein